MSSSELTPEDEAMLARCFSRFKCRLMLFRMGVPLTNRHPVSDEEYQKAIEGPCPTCNGTGHIEVWHGDGGPDSWAEHAECPDCV